MKARGRNQFEDDYRRSALREDAGQVRILTSLLAFFALIYAYIDFRLVGPSRTLLCLYLVRAVLIVASVCVALFIGRIKSPRAFDRLVMAWLTISLAGILYVD